jgi:hypothetical protein
VRTERISKRMGIKTQVKALKERLIAVPDLLKQAYEKGYKQAILDNSLPSVYNQEEFNKPDDQYKDDHT